MTDEADLMTLIDFCNGMADRIRGDWSDPRSDAIWDAHDMAHVILGGDRQRKDWMNARVLARPDDSLGEAWEDVYRRMEDLIRRLEARNEQQSGERKEN